MRALFNPLPDDFSYEWLDDNNKPHILTIPFFKAKAFPDSQYEFMRKHLADAVLETRSFKNHSLELEAVLKEIEIK